MDDNYIVFSQEKIHIRKETYPFLAGRKTYPYLGNRHVS